MTFYQLYKKDECNMFYEIIYFKEENSESAGGPKEEYP